MKTFIFTLLLIPLAIGSVFAQYYYYSDNRQVTLNVDSTKVMILFDEGYSFNAEEIKAEYLRIDSISDYPVYENFRIANISTGE